MASKQAPSKGWMIVIPILFLEFLVLSLPAGVLPIMINEHFGARSYILLGYAQAAKGLLAFLASPALGAISDVVGRKYLFVACVVGSSAPYAILGAPLLSAAQSRRPSCVGPTARAHPPRTPTCSTPRVASQGLVQPSTRTSLPSACLVRSRRPSRCALRTSRTLCSHNRAPRRLAPC
eukprot:2973107-Prymnesium_polylepis.1